MNWYAYVGNDPVNLTDTTGMCPWCIGAAIGGAIEFAVQTVQVANGGEYNLTKIGAATVAGAIGVGLGQKAAQLASALSNGSKVAATTAQVAGAVTEAAGVNVIETSINNISNSITGDGQVSNPTTSAAASNATINTATGNVAGNLISQNTKLGNKKVDNIVTAVKGVAEGVRKTLIEGYKNDKNQ